MSDQENPTVEQSLHSIALSLIEINKELREMHRQSKRSSTRVVQSIEGSQFRALDERLRRPNKPSLWQRIWNYRYV